MKEDAASIVVSSIPSRNRTPHSGFGTAVEEPPKDWFNRQSD
jgi:hypothetical protein